MLKIIVAFDGSHFSEGAMRMATWLQGRVPLMITGVFISPVDYRELLGYSGMGMGAPVFTMPAEDDDQIAESTITKFRNYCESHQIEYVTHKDTNLFALAELIRETRFADCLIISSELFYENIDKEQPNEYLKRTLHESECPVLLVPENFEEPRSVILSYDGKASSVFAIKQFAYLFAECCKLGAMLFHAEGNDLPEKERIAELAARHYDPLSIEQLNHEDARELKRWLTQNHHSILVTGAFGRNEVSALFRKSYVTDIIRAHKIPVFVAHK